jgi:hypothetical protein
MVHQGVVMFVPITQVSRGSTISGKDSVISNTLTCCSLFFLIFQASWLCCGSRLGVGFKPGFLLCSNCGEVRYSWCAAMHG